MRQVECLQECPVMGPSVECLGACCGYATLCRGMTVQEAALSAFHSKSVRS